MNSNLQRISPLWESFPVRETEAPRQTRAAEGSVFKDVLESVVDNLRESEDNVAKTEYLLSTGQLDNPAQLGIAAYKAEISVSLLLQLRDRALTAYNELRNMNV